jgi:RNA polymerase sigma factor (sigma-70 family)
MASARFTAAVRHIRTVAAGQTGGPPSDGALLRAFISDNDQQAFEALLLRHGPMVLRVCQRTLRNRHDAEDALQAAFLVLAKRAGSIRKRESLASWLHGVAYRMATHAKRAEDRRHKHESRVSPTLPPDPALSAALQEVQVLLDEEIQGLPEMLRAPFILCCLENKSCLEAACQLGINKAAVDMRLSRARKLLQNRLARRGVSLTAALAAVALGADGACAAISLSLVGATAQAATLMAAGPTAAAGLVSAKVTALTEGALRTLFLTRLKVTAVALLAVALAGTGAGAFRYGTRAAGQPGGGPTGPARQAATAADWAPVEAPEARPRRQPARQAATAADWAPIARLINRLGSDGVAAGEQATKELDQFDAPALNALRKPAATEDPERKKPAERLSKQIERRGPESALLAPKRLRLVYRDTPLADAVAEFNRQSGYEVTLSDPQGKLTGRTITLDTGDVTFWQAHELFCRAGTLVERAPLPTRSEIILCDGKPLALPTDGRTAVRVRALPMAGRPADLADREIFVALEVRAEPKMRGTDVVAVHIARATDNQGQNLEQILVGREARILTEPNGPAPGGAGASGSQGGPVGVLPQEVVPRQESPCAGGPPGGLGGAPGPVAVPSGGPVGAPGLVGLRSEAPPPIAAPQGGPVGVLPQEVVLRQAAPCGGGPPGGPAGAPGPVAVPSEGPVGAPTLGGLQSEAPAPVAVPQGRPKRMPKGGSQRPLASGQAGISVGSVILRAGARTSATLTELSGTITVRVRLGGQPDTRSTIVNVPFTLKDVPVP